MTYDLLSRRNLLMGVCVSGATFALGCKDCGGTTTPPAADAATMTTAASDTVKVGVVMTLSGPQAGIGKELEQGLMFALERAQMKAGGKKIELVTKDDRNDPQVGADAAKELIEKEKVSLVIGPSHSHVVLAMRSVMHDRKVFLLNPNAGAAAIGGALCSPYIFNTGRMNPIYAEAMGRYLAKKGVKKVAVMAANFAAGLDMVEGFKATFVGEGDGKVLTEILPPLNTTDFAPFLAKLKTEAKDADAVFAFFAGELAIHFVKQYAQSGLKGKVPLYVTGYTVEQDVLPAQGDAALGILSVSVYSPFLDNDANKNFAPAYKEKYGGYASEYAVLAYDTGLLLVSALDATKGRIDDAEAFSKALMEAKIDSPRGKFKFGPNHTPIQNAYLREVVNLDGKLTNKLVAVAWDGYYYPGEGCTLPGVKN